MPPRIPPLLHDDAPPQSRAVYRDFHTRMGFPAPPNFILTQGHAPQVAAGTWGLVRSILVEGRLSRGLKEMIFVAISHARQCRYCEAAHIACCRVFGVNQHILSTLVADPHALPDNDSRDVILFTLKCAATPAALTDADFDTLRRQGYDEAMILELIAMSGLAVYANIMADATAMTSDAMFEEIGLGR